MTTQPRSVRDFCILLLALLSTGCDRFGSGGSLGAELFETCALCHGPGGAGNADIDAPAIGGLPVWYVAGQLENFIEGRRGKHADDLPGLRMRPMALTLQNEEDVQAVAEYVASLPTVVVEGIVRGNAGAGAATFQICVACHGPEGLGNELLHAPPLVFASDWYLLSQLRNFRSGARGADPLDTWGATMRPNTLLLDDDAMHDVVAYIRTLRQRRPET